MNINNCGSITIHKVTQNGDSSFGYTTTGGLSPSTFSLSNGGTRSYTQVNPGNYSVTENLTAAQVTAGWTLVSLTCTTSGTGTSYSVSGSVASITIGNAGTADCIYTNHLQAHPSISTAQDLLPNDNATITGSGAGAGGTITFSLFSPDDSSCAGTPALTQTVNVKQYTTLNQ